MGSSSQVVLLPSYPLPPCKEVVDTLGGGTLLDGDDLVLHSRILEAGKHYTFFKEVTAAPSLLDFEARFLQLLRKTYITQPSEEVLEAITSRLPAHMIACSTPERAAKLYAEAKLLPGASTAAHLFTQHKLRVNGPLYLRPEEGPSCPLKANDENGMVRALEHIHSKGLVHIDVKGDNMFVDMDGHLWLGDLGSAVAVDPAESPCALIESSSVFVKP
ncbi:hypothetical protein WJX75_004074 [Coccomyxa subellipsoidea]|uniref:Protein kinase domain-containing protein n=1 Tax=Coccomyxa subellipsoidea TaxID=248742 RepID=A0ABR2YC73_9CHLO